MLSSVLVGCLLLAGQAPGRDDGKPDLAAYRDAAAKAGRDADAQVRLALWCEAHGLTAERIKHLALATLNDPTNAAARGLLGLVFYKNKWQRPDDVSRQAKEDPARQALLKEYLEQRARAADKPDAQWRLALWCDQNGLKEQAVIHLRRVVTLDPKREAAWKRLGFKKQGAQWVKPEVAAAEKAEHEAQHRANTSWKPKLEHLRDALARMAGSSAPRLRRLSGRSPTRVPCPWSGRFSSGEIRRTSGLPSRSSARSTRPVPRGRWPSLPCSALGPTSEHSAAQILRLRDPRDIAELLVSLLRDPIKYKVKQLNGPGSQGELLVEGKEANIKRLYTPLAPPTLMPGFQLGTDANGMLVASRVFDSYAFSSSHRPVEVRFSQSCPKPSRASSRRRAYHRPKASNSARPSPAM